MKKRLTQKQKEEIERKKLKEIIRLISVGVTGGDCNRDEEFCFMVEHLSLLIPALKSEFNIGDDYENKNYLISDFNLDRYVTIDEVVKFYFDNGVRAL